MFSTPFLTNLTAGLTSATSVSDQGGTETAEQSRQLENAARLLPKLSGYLPGSKECPERTFINVTEELLHVTVFSVLPAAHRYQFCFLDRTALPSDLAMALLDRQDVSLKHKESMVVACTTMVLISNHVKPGSVYAKLDGVDEDRQLQKQFSWLPLAMIASPLPMAISRIYSDSNWKESKNLPVQDPVASAPPQDDGSKAYQKESERIYTDSDQKESKNLPVKEATPLPRDDASNADQDQRENLPTLLQQRNMAESAPEDKAETSFADETPPASPLLSPSKRGTRRRPPARARRREARRRDAADYGTGEAVDGEEEPGEDAEIVLTEAADDATAEDSEVMRDSGPALDIAEVGHVRRLSADDLHDAIPVARTFVHFSIAQRYEQEMEDSPTRRKSWPLIDPFLM